MAHIVFYEKPGCGGNARQKEFLLAAGHTLEVRDLLHWPWNEESLLAFLDPLPVAEWFNRAAPRVKSGEVVPEMLSREAALSCLLEEPLLIRRPLMVCEGKTMVGFEAPRVEAWLALPAGQTPALEGCAAVRCESTDASP